MCALASTQTTWQPLVSRFYGLTPFFRATRHNSGLPALAGDLSIEVAECGEGGGRQLQAAWDTEPGQTLLSVPFPAVFIDQVGLALCWPNFNFRVFRFYLLYAPTPSGLGSLPLLSSQTCMSWPAQLCMLFHCQDKMAR